MPKAKTQTKQSDSEILHNLVTKQKEFFKSGVTKPVKWRIKQLNKLLSAIKAHEADIIQALHTDLGKSEFEAYSTEIGMVYNEIRYQKKHVKKPAGARPGFVVYYTNFSLVAEPDITGLVEIQ